MEAEMSETTLLVWMVAGVVIGFLNLLIAYLMWRE